MSGKTAVGSVDDLQGGDRASGEPTLRAAVEDALGGAVPEAIVYRANEGSLDDPAEEWSRYDSVADLPERPVSGWDELYVYTETHVYRWLGVGFNAGPDRLPRSPDELPPER